LENGGTIDGRATAVINASHNAYMVCLDGSNGHIY